jgi:hypothetical protein
VSVGRARLAACLLASACGGVTPARAPEGAAAPTAPPGTNRVADPPAAPGATPLEGFRLQGVERPLARGRPFDVDELPVAEWGEPRRGAGFTLHVTRDGWRLWVSTVLFAEVVIATPGAGAPEGAARVSFTAFTAGTNFAQCVPFACNIGRLAFWSGFAPTGWTDAGVNVEMEDGDYDPATCAATPRRSLFGRAAAIVPGYVYGLRVREGDAGRGRTGESVVVFMPRGALVSATVDPTTPLNASNTGPFTRLTFPLERGTAHSASVRLSPAALSLWARLRRSGGPVFAPFEDPSAPHDDLLLGLDVAWQGDVRFGSLSLAPPPGQAARPYAKLLAAAKLSP